MSMSHGYRQNVKLFDTAMAVMAYCKERSNTDIDFARRIEDWCRDVEFTKIAYKVYQGCPSNMEYLKGFTQEVIDYFDILKLPMPESDSDESDCWLGVTCGEYLGYPDKLNERIVEKALQEFADDVNVGYLGEIFSRHPEWEKTA